MSRKHSQNNLTREEIAQITKEYNEKRKNFNFPTTSCSESGIESMYNLYPDLADYSGDALIEKLAIINYHIAFD